MWSVLAGLVLAAGCSSGASAWDYPKLSGSVIEGTWTYTPPGSNERFGAFLYSSPGNRSCLRNLTIFVPPATMCDDTFVDPALLYDAKACQPMLLEGPARLVDLLNRGDAGLLRDTCLQLSASDTDASLPFSVASDVEEAIRKAPRKHGVITEVAQNLVSSANAVTSVSGLPLVTAGQLAGGGFRPSPLTQDRQMTFYTRTDWRWQIPGVMKRLLPQAFAVMGDTVTGVDFLSSVAAEAERQNKTIAHKVIVTDFDWDAAPPENMAKMQEVVDTLIQKRIRYVLTSGLYPLYQTVFYCAMIRRGVSHLIQYVNIGYGCIPAGVYWWRTTCSAGELFAAIQNGGCVGTSDYSGMGGIEDYLVNRWTGDVGREPAVESFDLGGAPWRDPYDLAIEPTAACFDDPSAASASAVFRGVLGWASDVPIACGDAAFIGQSREHISVQEVAKLCPVSACAYNSLSAACRISCACPIADAGRGLQHPSGGPLCLPLAQMPSPFSPSSGYKKEHWRCEGKSCRPLAYAPSRLAFLEPLYTYAMLMRGPGGGFCPAPFECNVFASIWVFTEYMEMADALYALWQGYVCVERRGQLERLAAFEPGDQEIRTLLTECLEQEVNFQGVTGKVSFGHLHGPPPGHVTAMTEQAQRNARHTNGLFLVDDLLMFNQVIGRDDFTLCEDWLGAYNPGRSCNGTSREYWLSLGNEEVYPLGGPASCPLGEYPVALGENQSVALDACAPCLPGTFKDVVGPGRCQACPSGWFASQAGQSVCKPCAVSEAAAEASESAMFQDGQMQSFGANSCFACKSGFDAMLGSASCVECPKGRYRQAGVSPPEPGVLCTACPVSAFQSETGSSACAACPRGQETRFLSSTSAEACVCGKGMYKAGEACMPCGEGLDCVVGAALENVPQGPGQHRGPFETHPYPRLQPGFYSTFAEPLLPYKCASADTCPGGDPETCPEGSTGIACGECAPGFYGNVNSVCVECKSGLVLAFVLPVLLAPVVLRSMHRTGDVKFWGTAWFAVPHLAILLLFGMQTIGISAMMEFPAFMRGSQSSFNSIRFGLKPLVSPVAIVSPECTMGDDAPLRIISNIFSPLYVAVLLAVTFAICYPIPKVRMNPYITLSVFGSLYVTFFLTIAEAAMSIFQCYPHPHPNKKSSMVKEPDVLCFEGSWNSLAAVGAIGIFFFVVCAISLCVLLLRMAPKRFHDKNFRMLTKFLTMRFRFGLGWWSLLLLARGFWLNLGLAMFSFAVGQITWMAFGLGFYALGVIAVLPWRHQALNFADAIVSLSLAFVFLVSGLDGTGDNQRTIDLTLVLLMISILLILVGLFCYYGARVVRSAPDKENSDARLQGLMDAYNAFTRQPGRAKALLAMAPTFEVRMLVGAAHVIKRECDEHWVIRCTTLAGDDMEELSTSAAAPVSDVQTARSHWI